MIFWREIYGETLYRDRKYRGRKVWSRGRAMALARVTLVSFLLAAPIFVHVLRR